MNKLQNTINLIGRAGIAPIIRTFENGVKMAKFSLATNEIITEVNGKKNETQWHNIVAWGKKAELIEKFVKKGQLMAVDGKLVNRAFTSNDGSMRRLTEIQVNEILLINSSTKAEDPKPTPAQIIQLKKKQVKELSASNKAEKTKMKKAS